MSESKPTAAAMRAARRIYLDAGKIKRVEEMAEAIDRETGLPELLDACKAFVQAQDEQFAKNIFIKDAQAQSATQKAWLLAKAVLTKLEGKP